MKKFILVFIFLLLISSCVKKWDGFSGLLEDYEYFYISDREKQWEEDIVETAASFLNHHPILADAESKVIFQDSYWLDNYYDKEIKDDFISRINQLIPQIQELSDEGIVFGLQKIIASLNDGHASIDMEVNHVFPVFFELFYEEDGVNLYVVHTLQENESLLFSKLISINGFSIDEIIQKIEPYLSYENKYGLYRQIDNVEFGYSISQKNILCIADIMDEDQNTADFVFEIGDTLHEIKLECMGYDQFNLKKQINYSQYKTYTTQFKYKDGMNYWYEDWRDKKTIYTRIGMFKEDHQSFFIMSENIRKSLMNITEVEKMIIDLRGNPGGEKLDGYTRFIQLLEDERIKKVYILINDESASRSILYANEIKEKIDKTVIVGIPGCQKSTMMGARNWKMNNSKVTYSFGQTVYKASQVNEFSELIPDIVIYPNIHDYKAGVDTILNYVLEE